MKRSRPEDRIEYELARNREDKLKKEEKDKCVGEDRR